MVEAVAHLARLIRGIIEIERTTTKTCTVIITTRSRKTLIKEAEMSNTIIMWIVWVFG
jgi:hypothetical protein